MKTEDKLRLLVEYLQNTSKKCYKTSEKRNDPYVRGQYAGEAIGYELCAQRIEEILKGNPT